MSSGSEGGISLGPEVAAGLRMVTVILFIGLYAILAALYLWIGVENERKLVKLILKCLPLVSLAIWFVLQWTLGVGICYSAVDNSQLTGIIYITVTLHYFLL